MNRCVSFKNHCIDELKDVIQKHSNESFLNSYTIFMTEKHYIFLVFFPFLEILLINHVHIIKYF